MTRPGGATLAAVATEASVIGSGPAGVVLALGRTAGILALGPT